MNCKKCNAQLAEDAKFCPVCGEKVVEEEKNVEEEKLLCKKCKAELKSDVEFCPCCGEKVNSVNETTNKVSLLDRIKKLSIVQKAIIIIVICAIPLGIIICNVCKSSGYDTCEELLDALATSVENNDSSKLDSTLYKGEMDYYKTLTSEENFDALLEKVNASNIQEIIINTMRLEYGADKNDTLSLDYSLNKITDATSGKTEIVKDILNQYCNVDTKDIQSVVKVKFDAKIICNGESDTDRDTITAVQVNDKWYFMLVDML